MTMQAGTNAVEKPGQYGNASFDLDGYDVEKIEPDAYEGAYQAKFVSCKWKMTSAAPPRPMILLEWKLVSTESETDEAQKSLKANVTDYIVLAADRTGNQGKVKLRQLRDSLNLDVDFSRMNPETITALAEALKAIEDTVPVWITNKVQGDGNVRTNIQYAAPGAAAAPMTPMGGEGSIEEEEEEPEEPEEPKVSTKGKGKAATKASRR